MDTSFDLLKNRDSLLGIFYDIFSGRSIELIIDPTMEEQNLEKECCLDAIIVFKYKNGLVEFPIREDIKEITLEDEMLATDLHSIVICEEGVNRGILSRYGLKYQPKNLDRPINLDKFNKKYLILK